MFDYAVKSLIEKRDDLTSRIDLIKSQISQADYISSTLDSGNYEAVRSYAILQGIPVEIITINYLKDKIDYFYSTVEEICKDIKDINDALDALRQKE